jgi:hypothetical protein
MSARPANDARQALRRESEQLEERLVSCLPAVSFEMETLVRLAGIEASREIPSAAVTCVGRPRLLVNPDFVAAHCASDEHFFLLVLHELWHVLLAHTRLYPRVTPVQNIALDAVINAGLCRQHPGIEYRSFFEGLNPADEFPALLLRPPEGWPDNPCYDVGGPLTCALLARLYPPGNDGRVELPLYAEILELIELWQQRSEKLADLDDVNLIGDHESDGRDPQPLDDPLFGETVRRMVEAWPPPPFPLRGRDAGGNAHDWLGALVPPGRDAQRAFASVLRRVLGPCRSPARVQAREEALVPFGRGPLPNAADRTVAARRALGLPTLLQEQSLPRSVRVPNAHGQAHVYIDVSGSMYALLPYLGSLLLPFVAQGIARLFQFSTEVQPLTCDELRGGRFRTTGGTDIRCVFSHALAQPRIRRVLVLTDGYVGEPPHEQLRALEACGLRLHAVLPAESAWTQDLEPYAASLTLLPPIQPTRGQTS